MKNNLGNKLIDLRKQNKMTQEQVADKIKVTRQTVSNWELNQTKPDLEQITGLSKLYKISVDSIIDNDIKDILTEKISNIEKLTGFAHKLLVGILVCAIIFVLLFIVDTLTRVSSSGGMIQLHFCSLNNQSYEIKISAESEKEIGSLIRPSRVQIIDDSLPITRVNISPFIAIPDLEKYDKLYQIRNVIFFFFESKGGSCY